MDTYREIELNSRFQRYIALTEGQEMLSIQYIASATCLPYSIVVNDLQQLIGQGAFGNEAYINYLTKSLVLHNGGTEKVDYQHDPGKTTLQKDNLKETVRDNLEKSDGFGTQTDKKKYKVSLLFLILGILLIGLGIIILGTILDEIAIAGFSAINPMKLVGAIVFCGGGSAITLLYCTRKKQSERFVQYRAVIGSHKSIQINRLAEVLGISYKTVQRDLKEMLNKGLLGSDAYINTEEEKLILKASACMESQKGKMTIVENQYYEIICNIRQLNEDISDPDVSNHIAQIEVLTAKIFRIVEEKPEKQAQIKSFMSYYLPTTLKLLHFYSMLEKQKIEGSNINSAKEKIERILEILVQGFERQLDQLFVDDVMDISTDVAVLESMLKKDGLFSNGFVELSSEADSKQV